MPDRVGVQLAADDASKYFATLDKVNKVTDILVGTTNDLVGVLGLLEKEERGAGAGAKGMGDDVEQGSKKLSLLEQATIGATRRLGEFAVDGARMAAQAVLDFTKDGVKAAGDFEAGMNTFAATVGGELETSGQSLNDFKQLFITLGRDLPVSTQEVQQAAIELSKGGIDPATIAAGGLKQALQFAAASGLDLADAAQISAKVLQGWVPLTASATDKTAFFQHATDLLTKATTAAATNVDQLSLGLFNVQGAARSAGVPLDDTVTTLALLTPSFSSSATAGDSMKNMLLSLIPKSTAAADAMANLGLLTKDGNSAFYDAKGHFIGMRATADKLQKALGNLSEAQRTEALRTIFGNDALNAANVLVQAGAKGYDEITKKIALQNGVAEQAALKQQGFNVAVDNLMGSLEAFQITVFSRALPALTGFVNLLAKGINVITDYAEATANGQTALASVISFVGSAALPTISGLTAALTAYAVVQTVQATPAILASIPSIVAQTAAFVANAAAVAAALAPYVLIAAAVAGVISAYQRLQDQVASVTDKVLAGSQAWQDSVQALVAYDAAGEGASEAASGQAKALRALQTEQRGAIEQYALHVAAYEELGVASGQTVESLDQERLTINARGAAIIQTTAALNDQMDAEIKAQAASVTASATAEYLSDATAQLGDQAHLTAEDITKLKQSILDTYQKGGEAVQGYATTQSEFLSGVEQRQQEHAAKIQSLEAEKNKATTADQKKAIDEQIAQANQGYHDQEQAAAESYMRQQAEQQKHLGQMLIDYTVAQAQLGQISNDKAIEITQALEKQYGLQQSSVASTFLSMKGTIDTFAKDSSGDINELIDTLHTQQQQAANTQKAMDDYAKDYTATAVSNFIDAKGDADDYIHSLETIPTQVQSVMHLPDIDDREQEIRDINRGLQQIPKEVRIHISVKDDVPPVYKPGSPTPFEIGIRGITSAVDELAQTGVILPGLTQDVGDVAGGLDELITESNLPDDAKDLGDAIMAGWSDGMYSAFDDLLDQVDEMSDKLIERMNDAWDTHSPSGVTEDLGDNIMLGLLNGLDTKLPDILATIEEITASMMEGMNDLTDEMQKQLEDRLKSIADTVEKLPDLVNKSLASAYDSTADFLRQQSDNLQAIFNLGQGGPATAQFAQRGADLEKQIAEHRAKLADIQAGRLLVNDEDRKKLEQELTDLSAQRAQNAKDQADAERQQQQRLELQKRTQDQIAKATAEASAMNDPAKEAAFLKLRSQQILRMADLEKQRLETTDPKQRAMIDAQIALEQKAQEAELKSFEVQKDQIGVTLDLIAELEKLNKNLDIPPITTDPALNALNELLKYLSGLVPKAGGGAMAAMQPYLVGERGPELVIPERDSQILNTLDTRRALAPATMIGGASTTYYGPSYTIMVDARGSNLTEAQIAGAVRRGMDAEGARADVRIRMGVN